MTFRIVHIGAGEWSTYAHGQPDQHLLARGCRQPPNHAPETQNHVLNNPMQISGRDVIRKNDARPLVDLTVGRA